MGNTTSSDPCEVPFIKVVENTASSDAHAMLIPDYSKFVQDLVKDHNVFVFTKFGCPYSSRVRQIFLEIIRVKCFAMLDVDLRSDCEKILQVLEDMTGSRTLPRVFVNGECIGGASETEELHKEIKVMVEIQECKDKQSDD